MFPYKKTGAFQMSGLTSQLPKKPGNTPLSGTYLSFLDINTTHSTWHDTCWLMSGSVPVRGNISCQNGNRSTASETAHSQLHADAICGKMTFISRSWPSKSTGTNRYKAFSTYIMQGNFTLLLPATVSTVETVKASQLLHNSSALTTNLPYTRRELSCRISPSRPGIRSSFYLYHICSSFH